MDFFGGEVMTILTPLLMEYVNQNKLSNALGYIGIISFAGFAFAPKIMGENNIEKMLYLINVPYYATFLNMDRY